MASSPSKRRATDGFLAALALFLAAPASAATITVTSTFDTSVVACTLRDAIEAANTDAPRGACPPGAGDDVLDLKGITGTIPLGIPLPEITSNVQILGPDATSLTIDGQDAVPVFRTSVGTVTIADLTIARGLSLPFSQGGGVLTVGGSLSLVRVVVRGCAAFQGGGVSHNGPGTLTIDDSAIVENQAPGNFGGGILVSKSTAVLRNTTVALNAVPDEDAEGGGLGVAGGAVTIVNCTFAYNQGELGWSIANHAPSDAPLGTINVANTIIFADSPNPNCKGPVVSDGHNIADDDTCGLTAAGDRQNTQPGLGEFDPDFRPVVPLVFDSVAVDAGDPARCPAADQRGIARPVDGNGDGQAVCDIGAFEIGCGERLSPGTSCGATPCADDVCDAAFTCQRTNNTAPCEDGDPCTLGDACGNGVCNAGAGVVCPVIGGLTYQDCITGEIETGPAGTNACVQTSAATSLGANSGLDNLRSVALSADGRSLYVASGFDDAIARFARDPATGALAYQDCITGETVTGAACAAIPTATPDGTKSGLHTIQSIALSADGRSLYAAAIGDDAIARFDRDPATGALTYRDCITGDTDIGPTGANACVAIPSSTAGGITSGLDTVRAVIVSPDGRSVYAAATGEVAHFDRDPATGALTYRGCITGVVETGPAGSNACTAIPSARSDGVGSGLNIPLALAISPDGKSLYAAVQVDDAVTRFDRDATTGALTYRDCITGQVESGPAGTNACTAIATASTLGADSGLDNLYSLAPSPDGTSLYVVSQDDDAVARFDRDPATGTLTYRDCFTGELQSGAPVPVPGSGACTEIRSATASGTSSGLDKPRGVAVGADGRSVYVMSPQDDAVTHFVRDPATGALTYDGCLTAESETGPVGTNACVAIASASLRGTSSGLDNPQSVAVGPDGLSFYAASGNDAAVARFAVRPAPGSPPPGTAQPISGALLLIADHSAKKRAVVFTSKDPSVGGIDPLANGAVLQVFNDAVTSDSVCLDLPAAGWSAKGKGAKRTLRYRDKRSARGPCRLAAVKDGKVLHVACRAKRKPIDYSLDEPAQQSVAVRFRSGAIEYCTVFGGTVAKDRQGKLFKAQNAPAPETCPDPPVACP
jgi:6-phosphogluconolactonase (cycloisomerase 2 family)